MANFGDLISLGLAADRPTAGTPGRLYFSTDTETLERDNGASWDSIDGTGSTAPDHDHTGTGDGGKLTAPKFDSYLELEQQGSDPSAPGGSSNILRIYAKDKSGTTTLYYITEGGTIYELPTLDGGGGGGSGAPADAHYVTTQSETGLSAEVLLSALIGRGVAASRPVAGTAGRIYYSTDTGALERDNGSSWDSIGGSAPSGAHYVTTQAESGLSAEVLLSALIGRGVAASRPAAGTAGALYYSTDTKILERDNGASWDNLTLSGAGQDVTINFLIDGGGSAIATGVKGDLVVDFAATITGVTVLADQSGSIVVDLWRDAYSAYPPTGADSICASAKPTISSALKSQDTTLTGWTTGISAGDTLRFNVDSCSTITRATIALTVRRS